MTEPEKVVAGDSVSWTITDSEHPGPTWAISYALVNSDGDHRTLTSTANVEEHTVTLTPAQTADWQPGTYTWQRYANDGSDRVTTGSGSIEVAADLQPGSVDLRTTAKQILDAIDAVLKGKASQDQLTYSLNGRSLTRMTWADLIAARSHFKREVDREEAAARVAAGQPSGKTLRVRFQ